MDAIYNVPAERAKAILIALCNENPSLRYRAKSMLSQMEKLDSQVPPGKKRKAESAVKVCVQCQEPFYEEDNCDQACRYHSGQFLERDAGGISQNADDVFLAGGPVSRKQSVICADVPTGDLDPDDSHDFWADHDENCHGLIDTDEQRMEFPEGFVWSCCNKLGHRSGCTFGRHTDIGSHRGRFGTKPGTYLEGSMAKEDTEDENSNDSGSP